MPSAPTNCLLDAARAYLARGYRVVPIPAGSKGPVLKGWQRLRLTEDNLLAHFGNGGNIGLILGAPSGGLTDVDLDCEEARSLVAQYLPPTPARTGRPGAPDSHWWYITDGDCKPTRHSDPVDKRAIVELRSTGQQTLVGPSVHPSGERYDTLTGEPARVDTAHLAACVAALADAVVAARHGPGGHTGQRGANGGQSCTPLPPTDDVERRALAHLDGLPAAISGQGGHDATYTAATALVHGFGLSRERALSMLLQHYNPRCRPPWSEKELRHKVDDAADKPHNLAYGWLLDAPHFDTTTDVDLSQFDPASSTNRPTDPGPLPDELLRVPGFVGEVMDFCLETAPYPNHVLAFGGALALQAFLAGRKVRDPGDNRTNLYVLGLAHSAAGKDAPRKLNTHIVHAVGLGRCLGDRLASGEGIQDALYADPAMLVQTDEIDGMLQSINRSRDGRHESMMGTLLTLYSASNSIFPMRRKAGKDYPGVIDQPCLVLFGTAIPTHYYQALSERMLTNGFFARMLILEASQRGEGQEPCIRALPARIMSTARWWADYRPNVGNLGGTHPAPTIVEQTDEAREVLTQTRLEADAEYARAEAAQDAVGTTVWGRVSEQARKLALIYAVSESHRKPRIGIEAARWASTFVMHHVRRMLFMAASHVADNPFHADCLRLLKKVRDAPNQTLAHQVLLKRMKMDAKSFQLVIETLIQRGDITVDTAVTAGRPKTVYRLANDAGEEG